MLFIIVMIRNQNLSCAYRRYGVPSVRFVWFVVKNSSLPLLFSHCSVILSIIIFTSSISIPV
jgi:hypothetical protein